MRKIFVLQAAAAALTTAACNTVAGVGQDAQAAGQAVENCAEGRVCCSWPEPDVQGPVAPCGGAFSYARARARLGPGSARQMASEDRWPKPPPPVSRA